MRLRSVVASLIMFGSMAPVFAGDDSSVQQSAIDQNSIVSPICSEGWFNRISVGGVGSIIGITGNHDPAGAFTGIGNSYDVYVNNFNLLVNANLNNWSKVTLNLAYLGAPVPWNNMHAKGEVNGDKFSTSQWSYRHIKHAAVTDEAYIQISHFSKYPFYFVFGKKYLPFGEYSDPHTPYQIMSPVQMLTQTNAVTAIAGVTAECGFYGSVYGFKGQTYPIDSTVGNIRNFGAKVGYHDDLELLNIPGTHINFNLSYLHNIWDSEFFGPNTEPKWSWIEKHKGDTSVKIVHPVTMIAGKDYAVDPVGGVSLHGDLTYKALTLSANFASALKRMVSSVYSSKEDSSKFWAADLNVTYAFKTMDHNSHLGAGVQFTGNGAWFGENNAIIYADNDIGKSKGYYTASDWCRIVPKWRLLGEYKISLFRNTDLGLVVAHGKSYDFVTGTGSDKEPAGIRNTTVGLARLMVQL
jgi:hypothetical protein